MSSRCELLEQKLQAALHRLGQARDFAKGPHRSATLDLARRLLLEPGGVEALYSLAPRLDEAGVFNGSDWAAPSVLQPGLVSETLRTAPAPTVVLECMSELRFLAVANGRHSCPDLSDEQARHFLTQVLALNLDRLFGAQGEADRVRLGDLGTAVDEVFRFLLSHIGFTDMLGSLVDEIWRILTQRPIQVGRVKAMITQIATALAQSPGELGDAQVGADRLISALFSPTRACRDDPGLPHFRERLEALDRKGLQQEARGFARAMHDVGLVSDYHATFLRWLLDAGHAALLEDALGLGATGLDSLRCHRELVHALIRAAVHPETAQCVYGLAMLLERGSLHAPPIAPSLQRHLGLRVSPRTAARLAEVFGESQPPEVFLLAGLISVLGQPLGIGQGNNPTCQAARAMSMWSHGSPDYLLHLVAQAASFDEILMHFEGQPIRTAALEMPHHAPFDTDAVSTVLVPHLDRVYNEMFRLCEDRGGDPHRWINPELHGWWVRRGFAIAVDVQSGELREHDTFVRRFYASYHPAYGGDPIMHPQPAGLAATDSLGSFVGWHAITLLRVAEDQAGTMRVYFYNPNNDSGQHWGHGVVVSTQGHREHHGEASLPFPELASRLYIFHDDALAGARRVDLPEVELEALRRMAIESWAADRVPDASPTTRGGNP